MRILFVLALILVNNYCYGQDLIVTKNNDSINCQIVEEKGSYLIYKTKIDGLVQQNSIKLDFVLNTEHNYYIYNPKQTIKKKSEDKSNSIYYLLFGISNSSLTDYAVESGNIEINALNKTLSNAISFNTEIEFCLKEKFGIGLRYEYYKSRAQDDDILLLVNGVNYHFYVKEELRLHTLSPKINFKTSLINNKNHITFSAMYDYNFYFDDAFLKEENFTYIINSKVKSRKSGFGFSAGYEYHILPSVKIGLITSYKFCTIDAVIVNDELVSLSGGNEININRLSFGMYVGFR